MPPTTSFRGVPAAAGQQPSWRTSLRPTRRVAVRPSALSAAALTAIATLAWLAVAGYGMVELDALWSVLAALSAAGVLVLTLRGFPLVAAAPLVLGAFVWGLATRAWLPASGGEVVGLLRFVGANLAFVVPVLVAYVGAIGVDSRRLSRAAVEEAISGRRWWGETDDHMPQLAELEAIPAARFFALTHGACSHLIVVGRRVALMLPTVWPRGEYAMDPSGQVLRGPGGSGLSAAGRAEGARPFGLASGDLDGLADDVRRWQERLEGTGASVRGFLVIHPPRDGSSADVHIDIAPGERLHIVHAHEFADIAGDWLAVDPYRVDTFVMERLLGASARAADPDWLSA